MTTASTERFKKNVAVKRKRISERKLAESLNRPPPGVKVTYLALDNPGPFKYGDMKVMPGPLTYGTDYNFGRTWDVVWWDDTGWRLIWQAGLGGYIEQRSKYWNPAPFKEDVPVRGSETQSLKPQGLRRLWQRFSLKSRLTSIFRR